MGLPLSLLFSSLNIPSSLSPSSQDRISNPFIMLIALWFLPVSPCLSYTGDLQKNSCEVLLAEFLPHLLTKLHARRRRGCEFPIPFHFPRCLFTLCACKATVSIWNKSLLMHLPAPQRGQLQPLPAYLCASLGKSTSRQGRGGGENREQKPWSDSVSRWLLFALVSTALACANTTPSGNLKLFKK